VHDVGYYCIQLCPCQDMLETKSAYSEFMGSSGPCALTDMRGTEVRFIGHIGFAPEPRHTQANLCFVGPCQERQLFGGVLTHS